MKPIDNRADPPLAVVAYALAPGPGGPEASVNAALARRLVAQWRGSLAFFSGGAPPNDASGQPMGSRPGVETWAAQNDPGPTPLARTLQRLTRSSQERRFSLGRLASRALYERSGYSIKYHAFERGAAHLLHRRLDHDPETVIWSRVLPVVSMTTAHRALRRQEAERHRGGSGAPRSRWIVNFNDPCPPHIYPGLYPLDARTETKLARSVQRVLPRIDAATFPSRRLYEIHLRALPELERIPARIIPHAQDELPLDTTPSARTDDVPLVAFAGTLRHDHLGEAFAEALRRLARRRATGRGSEADGPRFRFLLTSPSSALESLARRVPFPFEIEDVSGSSERIDRRLAEADALLCFETEIDRPLLLTKIAGYLRFGIPILALCAPGGTSDELMSRSAQHRSVPFDDPEAIATALADLRPRGNAAPATHAVDPVAQRFDGATIADQLRDLLGDLAAGHRGLCGPDWP